MILVPVLFAVILFSSMDKKSAGSSSGRSGVSQRASAAGDSGKGGSDDGEKKASGQGAAAAEQKKGKEADRNDSEAADSEDDGEMGDLDDGSGSAESGEDDALSGSVKISPLQAISFAVASGGEHDLQRSIPVEIDAEILGGQSGAKCWAVFLPAEMADHPKIMFSKYKKVELRPLEEYERLTGARLWEDAIGAKAAEGEKAGDGGAEASKDSGAEASKDGGAEASKDGGAEVSKGSGEESGSVTKTREYDSGDSAAGLKNGSAFCVRMIGKDGTEQSENLYVFSCEGTASMYLDTASGSMETVDSDPTKETSEEAEFAVFRTNGTLDSAGDCSVRGRGNSTWFRMKRPYNMNLESKQSVLGMPECKKLCLLANTYDPTNLLDRISSQLATELKMRDTPQGEFVNLYLNGQYNGLYFLSQRPRTGGCVNIKKLDKKILRANGLLTEDDGGSSGSGDNAEGSDQQTESESSQEKASLQIPKRIALHETESSLNRWAFNWPNEPENNTGGYLLQQYSRYDGDGAWFSTKHRRFRVMSPSYPTVGEVNYIADYMLAAERAIYSEDGIDSESGKHYESFLDMPSWEDMFLLEEFFAEWDAERWSFYVIKDRDDPLLYCGPMWDFDHSAGLMIYGEYPETAVSMLLFRDTRHGWMYKLLSHDEFVEELHARWTERFSPLVHEYLDEKLEEEISAIESAAYMNNIRRANNYDFREKTENLEKWLRRRLAFLDDYAGTEDGKPNSSKYCCVMFEFPWGNLSHYVIRGEPLNYLPLPQYGEIQFESQIKKNEIIGWKDENGNEIGADIVIDKDRTFSPIIRQ